MTDDELQKRIQNLEFKCLSMEKDLNNIGGKHSQEIDSLDTRLNDIEKLIVQVRSVGIGIIITIVASGMGIWEAVGMFFGITH